MLRSETCSMGKGMMEFMQNFFLINHIRERGRRRRNAFLNFSTYLNVVAYSAYARWWGEFYWILMLLMNRLHIEYWTFLVLEQRKCLKFIASFNHKCYGDEKKKLDNIYSAMLFFVHSWDDVNMLKNHFSHFFCKVERFLGCSEVELRHSSMFWGSQVNPIRVLRPYYLLWKVLEGKLEK